LEAFVSIDKAPSNAFEIKKVSAQEIEDKIAKKLRDLTLDIEDLENNNA